MVLERCRRRTQSNPKILHFLLVVETVDGVVAKIIRIHWSLPPRLGIEEVEATKTLIRNGEREQHQKLDAIAKQTKGKGVPEELFFIYQEMQRCLVQFQCREHKKEAFHFLQVFDDLIQRASQCVLPSTGSGSGSMRSSSKVERGD